MWFQIHFESFNVIFLNNHSFISVNCKNCLCIKCFKISMLNDDTWHFLIKFVIRFVNNFLKRVETQLYLLHWSESRNCKCFSYIIAISFKVLLKFIRNAVNVLLFVTCFIMFINMMIMLWFNLMRFYIIIFHIVFFLNCHFMIYFCIIQCNF